MLRAALIAGASSMLWLLPVVAAASTDLVALDDCKINDGSISCDVTNTTDEVLTSVSVFYEIKDPSRQLPWATNSYPAGPTIVGGLEPGETVRLSYPSTQIPARADRTKLEIIIQRVVAYDIDEVPIIKDSVLPPPELAEIAGAIGNCWTMEFSSPARHVTVEIAFELNEAGRVASDTLELKATSAQHQPDAKLAFELGRRAILRCQGDGYASGVTGKLVAFFDPMISRVSVRRSPSG